MLNRAKVYDIGLVSYDRSREWQNQVFSSVKNGEISSGLIICRHEPVITLGRSASRANILIDEASLVRRGIQVRTAERGGDVTYHGPGQLVFYPIVKLERSGRDLHRLLRYFEQIIIDALAIFSIDAVRVPGRTGVWAGGKKISSLGIAVRSWICFHGIALNVTKDDLANFSCIRPCGMDIAMTSVESIVGRKVEFESITNEITERFIHG